jgi:glycerol-3-phosphate acyltransferase PlsX
MRIALDAMGGDYAPGPIVQGACEAVDALPGIEVVLVGDRDKIEAELGAASSRPAALQVFHCTQSVGMEEKPTEALRRKRDSSVVRCWELMAAREVDAVVSAGNTGAVVAAGLRTKLFLKGVKRPGIAIVFPSLRGPCVLLDVGANPSCKPEHLYQYGVMGSIYAHHILGVATPTVGLMNIGAEDIKGNELVRETHALFEASHLAGQYKGNVEGGDLHRGASDVVVCDGFVGNVVLKVCEGVLEMLLKTTAQEVLGRLNGERHLAQAAFSELAQRYDYSEFGGAPLLGIDGICIICHGTSGSRAIRNALKVATTFANRQLNTLIVEELQKTSSQAAVADR